MYTIGEMAKKLGVPTSTLRYYDNEGLIPFAQRTSGGARVFSDEDIQKLNVIGCLKKSGMKLSDIKKFMELVLLGDESISDRLDLISAQKKDVLKQIETLYQTLEFLEFKEWYYKTAKKDGTTKRVANIPIEEIPEQHREACRRLKEK